MMYKLRRKRDGKFLDVGYTTIYNLKGRTWNHIRYVKQTINRHLQARFMGRILLIETKLGRAICNIWLESMEVVEFKETGKFDVAEIYDVNNKDKK